MTKKANWKYLISPSIKTLVAYVLVLLIGVYYLGYQPFSMVLFVSSFTFGYAFLFYMAPILILYFTHKKSIRGKSMTWNGVKLVVKNGDMTFVWPDDFSKVEMYQTISA